MADSTFVFYRKLSPEQAEWLAILEELILSFDKRIFKKYTYGIPFFYGYGRICYITLAPHNSLKLGFCYGYLFSAQYKEGLAQEGRKQVWSITYNTDNPPDLSFISAVLANALQIDALLSKENK